MGEWKGREKERVKIVLERNQNEFECVRKIEREIESYKVRDRER